LPAGVGDVGYQQVVEQIVWPAARRFQPQLMLVSAGFDAHWADPLCHMRLTLPGYDAIVRHLIRMAAEVCDGKIAVVLEGGYHLTALSHGMLNVAHALLGDAEISDPLGAAQGKDPDIAALIERIKRTHRL
jgi:acetoin utilization deacetylase AcuC-like enzyme